MAKQKAAPEARAALPRRLSGPTVDDIDRTPVEMPVGFMRPTPLEDIIARMVRQAVEEEKNEPFETMEEADDFEEDPEHAELLDLSPYTFANLQDDFDSSEIQESPPPVAKSPEGASEAPQEKIGDPPDPDVEEPVKQP